MRYAALSTFAGIIVIATAAVLRRDRQRRRQDFFTAIGFSLFIAVGIKLHIAFVHWFPRTMDPSFLRWDLALGVNPLHLMRVAGQHPRALYLLESAYWLLSAMLGLAWVVEQNPTLRLSAFIGGVACFAVYAFFPAVGPVFYNWSAGAALSAPRNCMPSMHLTWAILMAWNAHRRRWQMLFWFYAVTIAAATVAIGQHYVIDLLAAVPYSAVVEFAAVKLNREMVQRYSPQQAVLEQ